MCQCGWLSLLCRKMREWNMEETKNNTKITNILQFYMTAAASMHFFNNFYLFVISFIIVSCSKTLSKNYPHTHMYIYYTKRNLYKRSLCRTMQQGSVYVVECRMLKKRK